ncbi:hypothetical protein P3X46_030063 [Hevea brasiliensis]|uniref:BLOC-1-related complex subunit 6 C-terminal helix domain-containing protein n=1 Tax=Hevea brasiliensis TaxID=3981 RepID=A0ABQ9KU63_HEVBR|nr:uncharacterized protein LOC110656107 isoform X2 [Hevea brasiliensis]KAJ9147953.1 hypothetical protein P3X46_030063 [Hevea brasiliensis]
MENEEEAKPRRQRHQSSNAEILITQPELYPPSMCPEPTPDPDEPNLTESKPALKHTQIFKALEVVERDSLAIAESFTSLFASLRLALSEVTSSSVDHMNCFGDAAGRLQESVLDAATKGNRYINSCLRLNEEMKGIDSLAAQLKVLRRNVDALDTAVNRLLRFP